MEIEIKNSKNSKFLLIGGTGRSGTTILAKAMGKHSDLTDVGEWRFLTDPDGVVDFYSKFSENRRSIFHYNLAVNRLKHLLENITKKNPIDRILGSATIRRYSSLLFSRNFSSPYNRINAIQYSPNFRRISEEFVDSLSNFSYSGYWVGMDRFEHSKLLFAEFDKNNLKIKCSKFLRDVGNDVCKYQNAKYHLEKNTWNILWFDKTLELLPEAKLVHIVRNPLDVISSYAKQPWTPSDRYKAATIYQNIIHRWQIIKQTLPENSYYELKLEDLVTSPKEEYKSLCKFWGIDWNKSLLDIKLDNSSFERWKYDLPKDEVTTIKKIVEASTKIYDYD